MTDTPSYTGSLALTVARRGATSIATQQYHAGALRILRPHYPETPQRAQYTIINPGGGYCAGDRYEITAAVESQAQLELRTQSATKVYRSAVNATRQQAHFIVAADAVLSYLPEQLIMYADANYEQDTTISVAAGSAGIFGEIITPGWSPEGKDFQFRRLQLHTTISYDDQSLAVDRFCLDPQLMPLEQLGYLEGYTHIGQLLVVVPRLTATAYQDFAATVESFPEVYAGVSYQGTLRGAEEDGATQPGGGARAQSRQEESGTVQPAAPVCLVVRSLATATAPVQALHEWCRRWMYSQLPAAGV